MTDLFEHLNELPDEVLDVLNDYQDAETYEACQELVNSLEVIGYTCDYYLDAVPFNLHKMEPEERVVKDAMRKLKRIGFNDQEIVDQMNTTEIKNFINRKKGEYDTTGN